MKKTRIIIAGGGPVGVIAALACAQRDYAVTLLEAEAKIDDSPRAATTHPSTLEMIARVGLIDQCDDDSCAEARAWVDARTVSRGHRAALGVVQGL